jgi:hypothetical protein
VTIRTEDGGDLAGIVLPAVAPHGAGRPITFVLEHFRTLVQAAGPTATAWVVPGFGHAESGATAPLVERIGRWTSATING